MAARTPNQTFLAALARARKVAATLRATPMDGSTRDRLWVATIQAASRATDRAWANGVVGAEDALNVTRADLMSARDENRDAYQAKLAAELRELEQRRRDRWANLSEWDRELALMRIRR